MPTNEVLKTQTNPPVVNKYAPKGAAKGFPRPVAKCSIPYLKARSSGFEMSEMKALIANIHAGKPPDNAEGTSERSRNSFGESK